MEAGDPGKTVRQGPFLLGLGLVTSATLALEVLDTRLLSVLTWYSLAFFVIAMGLCGLTAGAVRVYFEDPVMDANRLSSELSRAAFRFAIAVPVSLILLLVVPLRSAPVATTVALFLFFSLALALPFYPAGIAIAIAVTRSRLPIGRVYAVDLAGAALGAPLVPLLMEGLDGVTAILAMGVLAAVASCAFAKAGDHPRAVRRGLVTALALGVLCFANNYADHGLRILWVKERAEDYGLIEKEVWNSHSRIEIFRAGQAPATFWGLGGKCQAPIVTQRFLVIDGHAGTPLYHAEGGLDALRFIACDVTDVANLLRPSGPAAIIGVGGSRDVQAALLSHHAPVVGIELNDRMLGILKGPMGAPTLIPNHPNVQLVHEDGRSYLSRTDRRFRLIQASLIDTWAATGAGAHALGENSLYTVEAWRTFLDHLEPDGVFTVSRWSSVETTRMVALAVAALYEIGERHPRDHIALLSAGFVTTLIVGRKPLSAEDQAAIRSIAYDKGFGLGALPGQPATLEPVENVLSATSRADLDRRALWPLIDYRPSTDDRPFFFNVLRFSSLWHPLPQVALGALEGNLLATRTLGLTVLASLVLALGTILGPLVYRARPARRVRGSLVAAFAYFTLIGVGFMLVEIALLQRLSLVLGQPIYGLVVVLSGLVAATGLGAFVSDALPLARAPYCYIFPLVIAGIVVTVALVWPPIGARIIAEPTSVRIWWSVVFTTALGIPMGLAFPTGMRLVQGAHSDETPWLWGLNGVGSVMASSLAILVALAHGLTVLTLVGAACYVLLVPAIFGIRSAA